MRVAGIRETTLRNSSGRPIGYRNVGNCIKIIMKSKLA